MRRWALAAGLACALATCAATSAAGAAEERYWLGSQFEGLTLTDTSGASFIYGDCDPVPDGCAPRSAWAWTLANTTTVRRPVPTSTRPSP